MPSRLVNGYLEDENGNLLPSTNIEEFYRWAGLAPGKKVLDVGCGHGRNYIALEEKGCKVYGMDMSEKALIDAKKYIRKKGMLTRLVGGDVGKLPFMEGCFDAIYGNALPAKETAGRWGDITRPLGRGGKAFIKFVNGVFYMDTQFEGKNFMVEPKEVRSWFGNPEGCMIEYQELPDMTHFGDYGFQLTSILLVRIEKL